MSPEPIATPNEKMVDVYKFFERNSTIFTLVAIFGALAGFLYSFDKPNDDNVVYGILFLVFLIGLLTILIMYDVLITLFSLWRQKDHNFFTEFQIFFICVFSAFYLMFFESLIEFLYTKYPEGMIWLGILTVGYFIYNLQRWFNPFILKKVGGSDRNLIFLIAVYGIILFLILKWLLLFMIVNVPISSPAEGKIFSQTVLFSMIFVIYCVSSILYYVGNWIKLKTKSTQIKS